MKNWLYGTWLLFTDGVVWRIERFAARLRGRYCEKHEAIFEQRCAYCAPVDIVSLRYFDDDAERFVFSNGTATVHAISVCDPDKACPIHRHSRHPGFDLPMLLRMSGLVEHTCEHGVGHPCPDSAAYFDRSGPIGSRGTWGIHGCDGCTHDA